MSGVWSHDERTALMVLFEEYPTLTTAQRGDIFGRIFDESLRTTRRRYAPQALADQVSQSCSGHGQKIDSTCSGASEMPLADRAGCGRRSTLRRPMQLSKLDSK